MTRLHLILALALACLASTAEAGPFRRRLSSTAATCTGPNCSAGGAVAGDTSTAQGVAEIMARRGSLRHFGGNSAREGIGEGPTRDAAIEACCYHPLNGKRDRKMNMDTAEIGAAQAANGRWFACIRGR